MSFGVIDFAVEELSRPWPTDATEPVHGSDGRIEYAVDLDKRAGRLLPDGSIDLRERNSAVAVTNSQVGARIVRSTAGEVGSDVRGEVLAPNDWRRRGTGTGGKCAPQRGRRGSKRFPLMSRSRSVPRCAW